LTRVYEIGQSTTIDHDTSRTGRWLHARRSRIALWLAVIEVVIAALTHDFSKWTIILLAAILVPLYLLWGRERNDTIRQVTWIAAASQALAIVGVMAAFIIGAFVLVIAGIFALIALLLIFADRR
jgi:cation transport ATPase